MKKLLASLALMIMSVPAWAGPAELAGVYVQCPKKDPAACPAVSDDFRRLFPNGQKSVFMMIRQNGQGYLAPDDRFTVDFSWQFQGDDRILLRMDDQKKTRAEYQVSGRQLINVKTGEVFLMSIADAEWNPEPKPFKEIHKKNQPGRAK